MTLAFNADPMNPTKALSKEVRQAIDKHAVESDADRVRVAHMVIESIRLWHKQHSFRLVADSPDHISLTDQATYAIRLVKQKLGVNIKYVKKSHSWLISLGTETSTVYG